MKFDAFIAEQLAERAAASLLRGELLPPKDALNLCSNDYLGLARQPVSRETATVPVGAGASRHVFGTHGEHLRLESALGAWLKRSACVLFSSGYAANMGLLQAVADPQGEIFSDEFNHASIVDGCRLAKAQGTRVVVYPHLNLAALEERLVASRAGFRVVITESYYSMDADSPDLVGLRELCDRYAAWLFVDEAHALGVFGSQGAGLCVRAGVEPEATIGTLGKAFGMSGAFVAGSNGLRDLLWNRARTLVYSTALSPWLAAVALDRLDAVREAESQRALLRRQENLLAGLLCDRGLALPDGRHGPIFPILFGSAERAQRAAAHLLRRGLAVQAIRPPTVPLGTARLRVTLNPAVSDATLEALALALGEIE